MNCSKEKDNGIVRMLNKHFFVFTIVILAMVYMFFIGKIMFKDNINIVFQPILNQTEIESGSDSNKIIEIKLTEEDKKKINEQLSGSNDISNIIGASAIFFTVLVITVNLFQFSKINEVDALKEELKESKKEIDELNHFSKEYKNQVDDFKRQAIDYHDSINILKFNINFMLIENNSTDYLKKFELLNECKDMLENNKKMEVDERKMCTIYLKLAYFYRDKYYPTKENEEYYKMAISNFERVSEFKVDDLSLEAQYCLSDMFYHAGNFEKLLKYINVINLKNIEFPDNKTIINIANGDYENVFKVGLADELYTALGNNFDGISNFIIMRLTTPFRWDLSFKDDIDMIKDLISSSEKFGFLIIEKIKPEIVILIEELKCNNIDEKYTANITLLNELLEFINGKVQSNE